MRLYTLEFVGPVPFVCCEQAFSLPPPRTGSTPLSFRPHRMHDTDATDCYRRGSVVCVCICVCVLMTIVIAAKTDELIEMPFGGADSLCRA